MKPQKKCIKQFNLSPIPRNEPYAHGCIIGSSGTGMKYFLTVYYNHYKL